MCGGPGSPLAPLFRESREVVVLTGAGISTESGLSDFRSTGGMWREVNPFQTASIDAWKANPRQFFEFYRQRLIRLGCAEPNAGHRALADLEKEGYISSLITQNVDGLHQKAGSERVIEVHGNLREAECLACGQVFDSRVLLEESAPDGIPVCRGCGSTLKPRVVLFGEALPQDAWERAVDAVMRADLLLVVGSSLQVSPVNLLPLKAAKGGATLAIINLEPTPYDQRAQVVCHDGAGSCLTGLAKDLLGHKPHGRSHT